ncbi:unannotated protein [freshwater metagenome]|uniref:Unannotated protein n=1 Tax=freshwater metagenome TaxID=449393 RepID=A0A6J7DM83_9ZZZZ
MAATLADLAEACGPERACCVARELTKMHEEVKRLSLGDAAAWMADTEPRGEYVIVVGPGGEAEVVIDDATLLSAVSAEMASGASLRDASASVAEMHAVPKRRVYELALASQRK